MGYWTTFRCDFNDVLSVAGLHSVGDRWMIGAEYSWNNNDRENEVLAEKLS
jgi:hypothetical protein